MRTSVKVVALLTIGGERGQLAEPAPDTRAVPSRQPLRGRWDYMILTPLWRVEPDALLARSVVTHGTEHPQTLLEAGRRLSSTLLGALSRAGVDWIYVESDLAEGITPGPLIPGSQEDACRESLHAVFDIGRRHNGRVSSRHVDDLCQVAAELLIAVRTRGGTPLSHDPTRPSDDPVGHALAVATVGLAIGEIIIPTTEVPADAIAWHLTHLGAGLLLHDIGTVATPPDVLGTRGPLNEMQREMVRWHTQAGEQMISGTVQPHVALVVSQHHEWFGGGGYPTGASAEDIHVNARIAAVADAYDALATRSLTTAGRPSDAGLRMVRMWSGAAFDPAVVKALEQVIAPFAPGCPVLLSDRCRGVVVENTPGSPQRPTVRVTHGPDGEPLTPHDRVLAVADEVVTVAQAIDHPSEATVAKRPASTEPTRTPSLAIRGIEAGGLLEAPSRAGSAASRG